MASVLQGSERVYETYYGLILFTKIRNILILVNSACAFYG